MRDNLPRRPRKNECGVVNLDSVQNSGTHWVCYCKEGNTVHYFDSFGNLKPPLELIDYFNNCNILYNHANYQSYNEFVCGHLCLRFLESFKWNARKG